MSAPVHIMVDLETLGTKHDGAIVQLGAVIFRTCDFAAWGREDTDLHDDQFFARISLASAVQHGGTIDPATVLWWMQQSDEARAELGKPGVELVHALAEFDRWIDDHAPERRPVYVWSNGPTFDLAILRTAYERIGCRPPWHYAHERCFRTLRGMAPDVMADPTFRRGVAHRAVDDAAHQAQWAVDIFDKLRGWA